MPKLYSRNGFEYYCERISYHVQWNYRPTGNPIYLPFTSRDGKSLKADIERFLDAPGNALTIYRQDLERASNVERAEREYQEAVRLLEARLDPERLPLRGNNPDKDSRRAKDAQQAVTIAELGLDAARRYHKILTDVD